MSAGGRAQVAYDLAAVERLHWATVAPGRHACGKHEVAHLLPGHGGDVRLHEERHALRAVHGGVVSEPV